MKKTMLGLLSIMLILAACKDTDHVLDGAEKKVNLADKLRWYGTSVANMPSTKGVADQSKLWNASVPIDVKFLNSPADPTMIEKIKDYAREWENYAGVTFNFVSDNEKAVVRIAFDWNENDFLTWSYTGNEARAVLSQNQPTAVFGGIEYLNEEELKGDVLRVFGQILGLEYEQRHLGWDDSWWKKDKNGNYYAQNYWETMFEGYSFDWELIRQFVFDPMNERNAIQTEDVDLESIMLWPYYTRIELQDRSKLIANYELSEKDKLFIGKLYPLNERPILVMTTEPLLFDFSANDQVGNPGELFVDWGDGEKISYQHNSWSRYWNIVFPDDWEQSGEERIVKVYGNAKDIASMTINGVPKESGLEYFRTTEVDLSKLTNLEYLEIVHVTIDQLNLVNMENLAGIGGGVNKINEFNISGCENLASVGALSNYRTKKINVINCPKLEDFWLYENQWEGDTRGILGCEHSFTNCPLLKNLQIMGPPDEMNRVNWTSLAIANCPNLESLRYPYCGLTDISITPHCNNLSIIELSHNKLTSLELVGLNSDIGITIDIMNNPIEDDESQIKSLAAQLPFSENDNKSIYFSSAKSEQINIWIGDILSAKNWRVN